MATRSCSAHEVEAGGLLGDGVLDLQARVALEEDEALGVVGGDEELDGGEAAETDPLASVAAASCSCARTWSGRSGAGAISTIFCRRALQRAVAVAEDDDVPVPSPSTWTSMCRAGSRKASARSVASPKAARASAPALRIAAATSSPRRTIRVPRPPPPKRGLSMTAPVSAIRLSTTATSTRTPRPSSTGMPAFSASPRASTLSPRDTRAAALGPTKTSGDAAPDAGVLAGLGEVGALGEEAVAGVEQVGSRWRGPPARARRRRGRRPARCRGGRSSRRRRRGGRRRARRPR